MRVKPLQGGHKSLQILYVARRPDKGEVFREDVPVDPSRPTQVFEAIPDDYDLEETFGVVSSKPKKTTKPIPSYMVGGKLCHL